MRRRLVIVLAAALGVGLAHAAAGRAADAAYGWSYDRLMHQIDRVRVPVGATRYRIDRALVVCNGVGRAITRGHERRWRRFTCTQAVLRRGTMIDVTFGVRVVDKTRFRLTGARYGP